jgi:hypothetical protein
VKIQAGFRVRFRHIGKINRRSLGHEVQILDCLEAIVEYQQLFFTPDIKIVATFDAKATAHFGNKSCFCGDYFRLGRKRITNEIEYRED